MNGGNFYCLITGRLAKPIRGQYMVSTCHRPQMPAFILSKSPRLGNSQLVHLYYASQVGSGLMSLPLDRGSFFLYRYKQAVYLRAGGFAPHSARTISHLSLCALTL